jgi:hypothetical protein
LQSNLVSGNKVLVSPAAHQESDIKGEAGDEECGEGTPLGCWLLGTGEGTLGACRDALRDEARDDDGDDDAGEAMPLGGMKAETRTLPPSSTSCVAALLASSPSPMLRVRTRRGRTEEGGEIGDEGLSKGGGKR